MNSVQSALRALRACPQNNFVAASCRVSTSDVVTSPVHDEGVVMRPDDLDAVLAAWCCAPEHGARVFARLRALQRLDAWDIEVVRSLPALMATVNGDNAPLPELVLTLAHESRAISTEC